MKKYRIVENCGEFTIELWSEQTYIYTDGYFNYSFKLVDVPGWVDVNRYGNMASPSYPLSTMWIDSDKIRPCDSLQEAKNKIEQFNKGTVIHEL